MILGSPAIKPSQTCRSIHVSNLERIGPVEETLVIIDRFAVQYNKAAQWVSATHIFCELVLAIKHEKNDLGGTQTTAYFRNITNFDNLW